LGGPPPPLRPPLKADMIIQGGINRDDVSVGAILVRRVMFVSKVDRGGW